MAIDPNSFTTNEVTARQLAKVVDGAWEQAKNTFASKNDAALTGTPTAPTPSEGDDSTKIATTAFVKNAVEQGLSVADALIYKGTIASGSTGDYGALTPAANKGDVYKVTSAGKIDGVAVEVGDMLICNTDETAEATADNYTTIVGKWDFIQGNTNGAVIGPSSAVSGNIAVFDGSAGDLIKDSGKSLSDFATAGHDHDSVYFKSAGSKTLSYGSAVKVGTSNGSDVNLTLPAITTGTSNGTIKVGDTNVSVRGLGSAAYVDVPVSGDASANQAVLGSDSRLALNSDVLIATYTTSASGTTLQELVAAYNAKKKIYLSVGGQYGTDTYEQLVPLSTVRVHTNTETGEQTLTGFYFNVYHDGTIHDGSVGTVDTYYRNSGGWGVTSEDVHYAEAAGRASTADNASGYIEGGAIAQNLAAKMNTNANNAASGALQNLTGQLMPGSSVDVGPHTEIYGSYTYGFNTSDHVNEPYRYTLGKLWSSYISGQTEAYYARRPFVKGLPNPVYYQDGNAVQYVKVFSNKNTHINYMLLANRQNTPGNWGIVSIPAGESENPYVEIDFDIDLQSTNPTDASYYIPPLINDKYAWPYLLTFCAATMNETAQTPLREIPDGDRTIFAVSPLCVGDILGNMHIYGHVRLAGFVPAVAEHDTYCIILGARSGLDELPDGGCYFHIKTTNVKVVINRHILGAS